MTLTPIETERLASFRRVARVVREASIISECQKITLVAVTDPPDRIAMYVSLLGREPFSSLALAVRLVYQQGDPANFFSVCNVLRRYGSAGIQARTDDVRWQFSQALTDPAGKVIVDTEEGAVVFNAVEVFGHWLYGIAFHQDPDRQAAVAKLRTVEARFLWSVQATSLQLAGRILDLDDVIADFLGEDHLPRI
jgi:hypothetical protein